MLILLLLYLHQLQLQQLGLHSHWRQSSLEGVMKSPWFFVRLPSQVPAVLEPDS